MKTTTPKSGAICVLDAPIEQIWESEPVKASLWRLLCFAVASSDWSRTHVNPLTSLLYRSNLGGIAFCIDSVLAMTKAGIGRLLGLDNGLEVIAFGYENMSFRRPARLNGTFFWRFILKGRTAILGKTMCNLKFEVVSTNDNEVLCFGTFKVGFFPVAQTRLGSVVSSLPRHSLKCVCLLMILIVASTAYKYIPGVYFELTKQSRFEKFIATADPATRKTVLEWNVSLLNRVIKNGGKDAELLKKVGTWEAGLIQYGPGP